MTSLRHAWLVALISLLLASWAQASAPTVSVTLSGPDEGWYDDDLTFTAAGEYSIDGETREEMEDGQASVSDEYAWSYSPAELVSGGGAQDSYVTVRYSESQANHSYTVSVTYTVTITYKDGTSDAGSATASKDVFIKGNTVVSIGGDDTEIMSGAIEDSNHQAMIRAHVQPAKAGVTVTFTVVDKCPCTEQARLSETSAQTDAGGVAETLLTSSNTPDEGWTVTVTAKCQGQTGEGQSTEVSLLLPDNEFDEPEE